MPYIIKHDNKNLWAADAENTVFTEVREQAYQFSDEGAACNEIFKQHVASNNDMIDQHVEFVEPDVGEVEQ